MEGVASHHGPVSCAGGGMICRRGLRAPRPPVPRRRRNEEPRPPWARLPAMSRALSLRAALPTRGVAGHGDPAYKAVRLWSTRLCSSADECDAMTVGSRPEIVVDSMDPRKTRHRRKRPSGVGPNRFAVVLKRFLLGLRPRLSPLGHRRDSRRLRVARAALTRYTCVMSLRAPQGSRHGPDPAEPQDIGAEQQSREGTSSGSAGPSPPTLPKRLSPTALAGNVQPSLRCHCPPSTADKTLYQGTGRKP